MDYKYIEQLMERYWNAETSLEEERILHAFFLQKNIPSEMEHLRALFVDEATDMTLGDDFDSRILQMVGGEKEMGQQLPSATDVAREEPMPGSAAVSVPAREVKLSDRLMPLFKAAAVVAIVLTLGGALQAPWDSSWNKLEDYAALQQDIDTVAAIQPIRAENVSDMSTTDSISIVNAVLPKD